MSAPQSLGNWMPAGVSWGTEGCMVEWIDFAEARMTEPFFDQTVSRLLENPCRNLCRFQTSMKELCDRFVPQADARPGGIVFHLSRCGSTLVAGMLKALRQHVVLSEPAPLEQLLRLRRQVKGVPEETWRLWLRGLLTVMGRRRGAGEDCWFLKCDAIHTLDVWFITSALPEVPWIFLHRPLWEVAAAHLQTPARAMVPGAVLPGWEELYSPPETPHAEHIVTVLEKVQRAALLAPPGGLFIEYAQLSWGGWAKVVQHFRLELKNGDEALVAAVTARDAKAPDRIWEDDRAAKLALVPPAIRADHFVVDLITPEEDPSWVPVSAGASKSGVVEWRRIGALRFTHPFFRDTIAAAGNVPKHETTIERLGELTAAQPGLPPAGFIFHLSRCGSTLLTQMLAALRRHIVLSEPAPVNDLLWQHPLPAESSLAETRLRWILSVLGRRRFPEEEQFFVKFDSWHALDLPLIRRAFPEVPWLFLYRDPVEILVSHSLSPGTHTVPGLINPVRLGMEEPKWTEQGLRTWAAKVLARIGEAALENLDDTGRVMHYGELPDALPSVLRYFRVEAPPEEMAIMSGASAHHSKEPWRPFVPDGELRQSQATPELRAIAEKYVGEIYAALEARRRAQEPL